MEDQQNENEFQGEENTDEQQDYQQQEEEHQQDEERTNETENEAEQGPLDPTAVMTNTEYIPSSSIPVENVSYCCCYIFMYNYRT